MELVSYSSNVAKEGTFHLRLMGKEDNISQLGAVIFNGFFEQDQLLVVFNNFDKKNQDVAVILLFRSSINVMG